MNNRRTFAIGDPLESTLTLPTVAECAQPHPCMSVNEPCAWEQLHRREMDSLARVRAERDAAYAVLRDVYAAVGPGRTIDCSHVAFYMVGQLLSGVRP